MQHVTEGSKVIDTTWLSTSLGKIQFLRVCTPLMSERAVYREMCRVNNREVDQEELARQSEAERNAWITYASLVGHEGDTAVAVAYVATTDPDLAKRPPPGDDPLVLRYLLKKLGQDVTNRMFKAASLAEPFDIVAGDLGTLDALMPKTPPLSKEQLDQMHRVTRLIEEPLEEMVVNLIQDIADHGPLDRSFREMSLMTTGGVVEIRFPDL